MPNASWLSKPTRLRRTKIFARHSCRSVTSPRRPTFAPSPFASGASVRIPLWLRVAAVSAKDLACRSLPDATLPREPLAVLRASSLPPTGSLATATSSDSGFSGRSKSRITPSGAVLPAASCSFCQSSRRIFTAPFMVTCEFHCTRSFAALRYCTRSARQPIICRLSSSGATSSTSSSAKRPPASKKRISFFRVLTTAHQTQSTTQRV
mmetsp:Transcript_82123/g.227768  ORF Transcript_82123/g.227768 Transcript_82123/m.227768 type:complete len:208 (+) Transcript_82123:878-1501(+)